MQQTTYEFRGSTPATYRTAKKIIPIITDFIGIPESVIDLGGGGGGWLKAFQEAGTKKVCCIDHTSVQAEDLLISEDELIRCDLSKEMPSPIKCDLAISTEFVEHVPKSRSEAIVDFLTKSSPIIIFAAAIPKQGGLGHINEQRPAFWKNLYAERGYERVDAIRPRIIFDETIPHWFRQNLYIYIDKTVLNQTKLASVSHLFIPDEFEIVHTRILNRPLGLSEVLRELVPAFLRTSEKRLNLFKK
jgi:hypothetical protein